MTCRVVGTWPLAARHIPLLGAASTPPPRPIERGVYVPLIFEVDSDLRALRAPWWSRGEDFIRLHRQGVAAYLSGDWDTAAKVLAEASDLVSVVADAYEGTDGDAASLALLSFLRTHNNRAPCTWRGYRPP